MYVEGKLKPVIQQIFIEYFLSATFLFQIMRSLSAVLISKERKDL